MRGRFHRPDLAGGVDDQCRADFADVLLAAEPGADVAAECIHELVGLGVGALLHHLRRCFLAFMGDRDFPQSRPARRELFCSGRRPTGNADRYGRYDNAHEQNNAHEHNSIATIGSGFMGRLRLF